MSESHDRPEDEQPSRNATAHVAQGKRVSSTYARITEGRRPLILVADDVDDVRDLIMKILRNDGYDVIGARNGRETLQAVFQAETAPDAIVLDVCMPEVNGLALLQGLRHDGWTKPIVIVSIFGDQKLRGHASRLGATAVLGKPFEVDDLRRVVADALRPSTDPEIAGVG